MIVALARKLAIALWRYVELGLIPEGALQFRDLSGLCPRLLTKAPAF